MVATNPQDRDAWIAPKFVRETSEKTAEGRRLSVFECRCGRRFKAPKGRVASGVRKTCGCKTGLPAPATKHGGRHTPEYGHWQAMRRRCLSAKHKDYARWGAKGISICERWNDFALFLEDMGLKPSPEVSLDRIDPDGNYEPGNVRWATQAQQARNRKDFTYVATPYGVFSLIDWAEAIGITSGAAHMRLKRGKLEGCTRA